MMVRLLRPWKARRVGFIFNDMSDGVGNLLIKRGIGEEVKPEPKPKQKPKPETKQATSVSA